MLVCPACGAEDLIEGSDECEFCNQPLTDLSIHVPKSSVEAALVRDKVSSLPVHPPVMIPPTTTVGEALTIMVEQGIGCILIVKEEKLVGIFSERDALLRLGILASEKSELPISEFMTAHPAMISTHDKIAFALHKMDLGGYRHLPLMEGDKPVSLISIRDLLKYITEHNAA